MFSMILKSYNCLFRLCHPTPLRMREVSWRLLSVTLTQLLYLRTRFSTASHLTSRRRLFPKTSYCLLERQRLNVQVSVILYHMLNTFTVYLRKIRLGNVFFSLEQMKQIQLYLSVLLEKDWVGVSSPFGYSKNWVLAHSSHQVSRILNGGIFWLKITACSILQLAYPQSFCQILWSCSYAFCRANIFS